ncbi:hypothetical protein HDU67_002743 [Dinochytrium kinnereticum]|nr:hypothetical protein HDU67_002743 [Dinochytrium kinnereticum]
MAHYGLISKRRMNNTLIVLILFVIGWAAYDLMVLNQQSHDLLFSNSTTSRSIQPRRVTTNSTRTVKVICEQPEKPKRKNTTAILARAVNQALMVPTFINLTLKELERGIDLLQIQFADFLNGELGRESDEGLFGGSLANLSEPFDVRSTWERLYAYSRLASKTPYNRTNFLQLGRRTRSAHLIHTILHDRPELHPLLSSQTNRPTATKSDLLLFKSNLRETLHQMTQQLYWWIFPRFKSLQEMADGYSGRGLVLSTGKYHFELALNMLVSLRTVLNSTIPVEVWYAGPEDLDSEMLEMFRSIRGVKTFDIYEYFADEARNLEGWAIKPFAILASTFKEVIFVDADVLFLQDPYSVMDRSRIFQKYGQLFFQDRTLGGEEPTWFQSFVPYPSSYAKGRRYMQQVSVHEMESGVVIVDKGRTSVLHAMLAVCKLNSKKERDENTYNNVHAYGGTIGYKNANNAICGGLYHPDEDLKPLWWNGGVLRNKHSDSGLYIDFEYAATDVKGYGIKWEWETDTSPFCLKFKNPYPGSVVKLSRKERWEAGMFVKLHREMKRKGAVEWLKGVKGVLRDAEEE